MSLIVRLIVGISHGKMSAIDDSSMVMLNCQKKRRVPRHIQSIDRGARLSPRGRDVPGVHAEENLTRSIDEAASCGVMQRKTLKPVGVPQYPSFALV